MTSGDGGEAGGTSGPSHFDADGGARMVDVGAKDRTERVAIAEATLRMAPETLARIEAGSVEKGDVLGVSRVAAIGAIKRTSDLIPMCHPLAITGSEVRFQPRPPDALVITVTARVRDRTGVEMEALTGAAVAGLTVYDMCKAIDRGMRIERVELVEKRGGKSGTWTRGGGAG